MNFYKLFILVIVLFQFVDPASTPAQTATVQKEKISIGLIIPLTGGLAGRGDDIVRFLPLIKSYLNSKSLKYEYDFIVEDGKCGVGNAATSATMKLINYDKIKYLISGCSGETLQAGPVAEKNKVILFSVGSLHPQIKHLGDYVFRTFIDLEKSFHGFANFMDSECQGKIAVITEENAFTFSVKDLFLKFLGDKIVYAADFPADSSDFNSLLLKANQKGAKGFYLNVMSEGSLANIVNQIKRNNFKQKLFSYTMPEAVSFRKATGSNSDNLYFIGTPPVKDSSPEFNKLFNDFIKNDPKGSSYDFFLRTSFDAIKSIADALEQVGDDTSKVKTFLYSYSSVGALGKIKYDSNGDIENLHYVLKKVNQDGKEEILDLLVKDS